MFSSYDIGYVIRAIMGVDLPPSDEEFAQLRKLIFPNIFDLKFLLKQLPPEENIKGGLQEIADKISVGYGVIFILFWYCFIVILFGFSGE